MNTEHMAEFAELAHDLNFTAAAKRLNITQPALSNHIQGLERECGCLLVERGGRAKPRLTPAGQVFLDLCTEMLGAFGRTMPRIKELGHELEGRVTVRTPRNEYSFPFIDYLFEFRKENPSIDVAMLPWSPADGVDDVLSGDVDLAYIGHASGLHSFGDKTLALVPYCRTQLYLWAEETNPLAHKKSLSPEDLDGKTVLIPANAKRKSWLLCLEAFQERTGAKVRVEERYCDSIEDLIMSKAGHGDLMLCDENSLKFAAYRLREHHVALPFDPPCHAAISMGYDAETSNAALLHLVEFLEAKMPPA